MLRTISTSAVSCLFFIAAAEEGTEETMPKEVKRKKSAKKRAKNMAVCVRCRGDVRPDCSKRLVEAVVELEGQEVQVFICKGKTSMGPVFLLQICVLCKYFASSELYSHGIRN